MAAEFLQRCHLSLDPPHHVAMRLIFTLFLIVWLPLHGVSLARAHASDHGGCGTHHSEDSAAATHTCHDHSAGSHRVSHAPADTDSTSGNSSTDNGAHCSACHLSFANYLASEIVVPSYDAGLDKFSSFASTIHSRFVSVPERIPVARM